MHRFFVPLAVVVALLVLVLMGVGRATAQEATPAASPAAVPPVIQQWLDAVNSYDRAAVAPLYAEDGIHEDIPSGTVAQGREGFVSLINEVQSLRQFRELRPVSARQVGDLAVLEHAISAIDLETGRPLTFRGVVIFELDGDQIRRSVEYYDVAIMKPSS